MPYSPNIFLTNNIATPGTLISDILYEISVGSHRSQFFQQPVFVVFKHWSPSYFPTITVKIGKIGVVATPECLHRLFDDFTTCTANQLDNLIHFLTTFYVVGKCNTSKAMSNLRRIFLVNVFRQQIERIKFKLCPRCIEKHNRWIVVRHIGFETKPVSVKTQSTTHIADTEAYTSYFIHICIQVIIYKVS